jgi:hypothetical protein
VHLLSVLLIAITLFPASTYLDRTSLQLNHPVATSSPEYYPTVTDGPEWPPEWPPIVAQLDGPEWPPEWPPIVALADGPEWPPEWPPIVAATDGPQLPAAFV